MSTRFVRNPKGGRNLAQLRTTVPVPFVFYIPTRGNCLPSSLTITSIYSIRDSPCHAPTMSQLMPIDGVCLQLPQTILSEIGDGEAGPMLIIQNPCLSMPGSSHNEKIVVFTSSGLVLGPCVWPSGPQ